MPATRRMVRNLIKVFPQFIKITGALSNIGIYDNISSGEEMLKLPSGKNIKIDLDLPPTWLFPPFKLKPGYFLARTRREFFDVTSSELEELLQKPENQSPLPKNIHDIKALIDVRLTDDEGTPVSYYFPLNNFVPDLILNSEDTAVWKKWIESGPVLLKMEMYIDDCYSQVEDNQKKLREKAASETGSKPGSPPDESSTTTLNDHSQWISLDRDYLNLLKEMHPEEPYIIETWVDMLIQQFQRLKAMNEGEVFFMDLYQRSPEIDRFRVAYLLCCLGQDKFSEVEEVAWDEVSISPHNIDYWDLLAKVFFYQDRIDETVHLANLGLARNPGNRSMQSWIIIAERMRKVNEITKLHKKIEKVINPKRKFNRRPPDNHHDRKFFQPKKQRR